MLSNQQDAVTVESAHPYVHPVGLTKLAFPNADWLEVRMNTKNATDATDILKVYANDQGTEELARLAGKTITLSGTATQLSGKENYHFRVPAAELWYRFDLSPTPSHASIFCSQCEFPITGKRFSSFLTFFFESKSLYRFTDPMVITS